MSQSSKAKKRSKDDFTLTPALRPGVMLVRFSDEEARQKGMQLHFQVTSDPCEFVAKAVVIPASQKKGHVVLAPPFDTDFSLCAMVAVTFMGGFFASPKDFTKATPPRGVTCQEHYKTAKSNWHLAVSAAVAVEFPTLPLLLRSIALAQEVDAFSTGRRRNSVSSSRRLWRRRRRL